MNELDSEVAGSSKDTQRIQPKTKTQLSRTERPVVGQESTKEIEKGTLFDHEDVKHPTRTERPLGGPESTKSCVLITIKINWRRSNKNGETREGGGARHWLQSTRTVTCSCERCRTSPSSRACEKIESHPHREALQADLQQSNVYNPISNKGDDPRIGQCRVIRVVWNFSKSTMFSLFSSLESRNCLLHFRTMLGWKRLQKKV